MNLRTLIFGIAIVVFIFAFLLVFYGDKKSKKYTFNVKQIVRVAIFGALSGIFYIFIKFPVPFLPSFLEFHFDEIPAFIASFAYGPITGILVLLVKTLIKLPFTTTLGVGELSDLVYSFVFIVPASLIYKRHRNFKNVILGLSIGTILQLGVSLLGNIYVMIPFYMKVMGLSKETILGICNIANTNIKNLGFSYGLIAVLPFNAIKDGLVIFVTLFSYKAMHNFIDKLHE